MKVIHKYEVDTDINMPEGAEIIHVGTQNDQGMMWVFVDTEAPLETRRFAVYGTGGEIIAGRKYVGTFSQGPFIWHVFERV